MQENKQSNDGTASRLPYVAPELRNRGSVSELTATGAESITNNQDGEVSYAPDSTAGLS